MFFFLSKVLYALVAPVSLIILAFLIYALTRIKSYFWWGIGLLLFFTNPYISYKVMKWYEVDPIVIQKNQKYDGIIILGGFISNYEVAGETRVNYSEGCDRMLQAIELFKNGVSDRIIYTSGADTIFGNYKPEAEFGRNFLIKCGIPDSGIWIESSSVNTYENAIFTKALLQKNEPAYSSKKYLLLTSGFHMKRALACFQKAGIPVDPYPADIHSLRNKSTVLNTLIPTYSGIQTWTILMKEWIGLIVYKIKGYT